MLDEIDQKLIAALQINAREK
ncbi:AsnC family transcriptional regulator, partial [Pseudomonas syringae pv. actinidiae]|nr:AsnC family transcriptional regulator [Pseudomonas syringae pv. actinidiae]